MNTDRERKEEKRLLLQLPCDFEQWDSSLKRQDSLVDSLSLTMKDYFADWRMKQMTLSTWWSSRWVSLWKSNVSEEEHRQKGYFSAEKSFRYFLARVSPSRVLVLSRTSSWLLFFLLWPRVFESFLAREAERERERDIPHLFMLRETNKLTVNSIIIAAPMSQLGLEKAFLVSKFHVTLFASYPWKRRCRRRQTFILCHKSLFVSIIDTKVTRAQQMSLQVKAIIKICYTITEYSWNQDSISRVKQKMQSRRLVFHFVVGEDFCFFFLDLVSPDRSLFCIRSESLGDPVFVVILLGRKENLLFSFPWDGLFEFWPESLLMISSRERL